MLTISQQYLNNSTDIALPLADTDHAPPESVRVAVEVLVAGGAHAVLLAEVDEVAREDEGEEPDVERRDQLLAGGGGHESSIRAQLELTWRWM